MQIFPIKWWTNDGPSLITILQSQKYVEFFVSLDTVILHINVLQVFLFIWRYYYISYLILAFAIFEKPIINFIPVSILFLSITDTRY